MDLRFFVWTCLLRNNADDLVKRELKCVPVNCSSVLKPHRK